MSHARHRGHTLVEIAACIAILGTILFLALPSLASARVAARHAACLSNMRGAIQAHLAYAAAERERFASAGPIEHSITLPSGGVARVGNARGLPNGLWASCFPDDWSGPRFSRALRCARDPAWNPAAPGTASPVPAFWMSMALWLDPATLRDPTPPDTFRWRDNRVGDCLYPSRKVLLFEQIAFCRAEPAARGDIENGHTPEWASSTGFVDGSARRLVRAQGVPGHHSFPFDATEHGVEGWDVP